MGHCIQSEEGLYMPSYMSEAESEAQGSITVEFLSKILRKRYMDLFWWNKDPPVIDISQCVCVKSNKAVFSFPLVKQMEWFKKTLLALHCDKLPVTSHFLTYNKHLFLFYFPMDA